MERHMIRVGAAVFALAAVLALGAATATASTSMAPSLRLRAEALERAHVLPHGFFSLTTVSMQTAPVDVVRNGVTYSMSVAIFGDPGFGSSLDVGLSRIQADGRAFQAHDYEFSPQSGISFHYDRKTLETATLDTTTAISPSRITGSFTATSVKARQCRLYDGRVGTRLTARGTMTWSAFDVVTSTAPFFGTIHTQPTAATIVKDPGCGIVVSSGAVNAVRAIPKVGPAIGGAGSRERGVRPCFVNRALGAKVGSGRFFGFEKGYGSPEIFELGLRQRQVPPDESEFHLVEAFAEPSTLPKPDKVGPGRFEATIRSEGGEFMNGSATFTSGPPAVRTGLVCRAGPRIRHFERLTYRGTLEPAVPPLVAAFDTLPLAVREGTPATYVVRNYGLR